MNKLLIGRHINTSHGFVSSASYAHSLGANVYQIFLGSPRTYSPKQHSTQELQDLRDNIIIHNLTLVVHANHMLNFCNPVDSFKHTAAIKLLVQDLKDSVKINAIGVVIHMGKKLTMNEDVAINNYVLGVKNALKQTPDNSTVILETGAGVGTEVCTSIIDLSKLYNRFTKEERKRIKFCIDTCHVFSAGYDLGSPTYVDVFWELVKLKLGWNNVACIHLNDSKCCLDSKKDRHGDITKEYINKKGLKKFVRKCYKKSIPMILETPCDKLNKKIQIDLVKKWCY